MPCLCIECGFITSCGELYCERCIIRHLKDDTERNLYTCGRFYGESLLREDDVGLRPTANE